MSQYLSIIVAAALVNNVVLVGLLGVSSLFVYSDKLQNAIELAWLSFLVMVGSCIANLLLYRYLLVPLQLESLKLLCFIGVSAVIASLLLQFVARQLPLSMRRLSLEFYLLTGNSAIIGVSLLNTTTQLTLLESFASSIGAALGFALLLVLFAALRQRLDSADVPQPFRGPPIYLISAGVVAMCLLGFAGVE